METFEELVGTADFADVTHADHVRIVEEERAKLIEEMRQSLRLMQDGLMLSLEFGNPVPVVEAFNHIAVTFNETHGCYCGNCEVPASAEAGEA